MIRLMRGSMLPRRMAPPLRRLVLAQVALGDPAVSPDGSIALYTRRHRAAAAATAGTSGSRRWTGGRARPLTSGDVRDSAPQLTPQGDRVLFLRDEQVWAVPLAGGEPEQLTALPHGVSAFALARPTARRLALAAAAPEPRFAVGPLTPGTAPLARVIGARRLAARRQTATATGTRTSSSRTARAGRAGAAPDARATGRSRASPGRPTESSIAFCADPSERADLDAAPAVYVVPAPRRRRRASWPAWRARASAVAWSPDGEHVAFLGIDEAGEPYGLRGFAVGRARRRRARRATSLPAGICISHLALRLRPHRLGGRRGRRARLGRRGRRARARSRADGQTALWRFPLDGEPAPLDGSGAHVHGYARAAAGASSRCAPPARGRARAARRAARAAARAG